MRPFRIKICGIRSVRDAMRTIESGADAIGLNFLESSRRYVPAYEAMEIAAAVNRVVAMVGVFVDAPLQTLIDVQEHLRLDTVQLHGDEPVSIAKELNEREIDFVKAIRVPAIVDPGRGPSTGASGDPTNEQCDPDAQLNALVKQVQLEVDRWVSVGAGGILLDAASADGSFGGTGTMFNWKIASRLDVPVPLILAGGLNPENVGDAILGVKPEAVDVASGVERPMNSEVTISESQGAAAMEEPGSDRPDADESDNELPERNGPQKDPGKLLRFSNAAREAFHKLKAQAKSW